MLPNALIGYKCFVWAKSLGTSDYPMMIPNVPIKTTQLKSKGAPLLCECRLCLTLHIEGESGKGFQRYKKTQLLFSLFFFFFLIMIGDNLGYHLLALSRWFERGVAECIFSERMKLSIISQYLKGCFCYFPLFL